MKFNEFIKDITDNNIVTIGSLCVMTTDILLNIIKQTLPKYKYYLIDNIADLEIVLAYIDSSTENITNILHIDYISIKQLNNIRFNHTKNIIIFIQTYTTFNYNHTNQM